MGLLTSSRGCPMFVRAPRRPGRQLPKSLVVIAVVALTIGLLLPAVAKVRNTARRTQCENNLKQMGFALHNYHDANDHFPPGTMPNADLPPERRLSWMMAITPYVESNPTYSLTDKSAAWDAEQNRPHTMRPWKVFACPEAADPVNATATRYVGVAGVGPDAASLPRHDPRAGVFGYDCQARLADFTDSNETLLLVETTTGGPWAQGGPGTVRGFDPAHRPHLGPDRPFGSFHRGGEAQPFGRTRPGCLVAMADGHVRFATDRITPEAWEALATINGGEVLPADW